VAVPPRVRPATDADRPAVGSLLDARWGGRVAAHDELIEPETLPCLVAEDGGVDGGLVGALTWRETAEGLEVMTLDSLARGAGTALLYAVYAEAVRRGCGVWLVTTNDNLSASAFYASRGLRLLRVDLDAVSRARVLKPEIPTLGQHGLPIRDELVFRWEPTAHEEIVGLWEGGREVGSAPRSEMRRRNLPHAATCVVVTNSAGDVYVHRRTDTKDVFPGRYDLAAGGVLLAGEDPDLAAERELAEELGVSGVSLTSLGADDYADDHTAYRGFRYVATWDGPITHQESEVAWGGWVPRAELPTWLAEREFVPDTVALLGDWLRT